MIPAGKAGYSIYSWLLGTDHLYTLLTRVRGRRAEGGHGGDEASVAYLYRQALGGFGELALLSTDTVLIDMTTPSRWLIAYVAKFEHAQCESEMPRWAREISNGLPTMPHEPNLADVQAGVNGGRQI